MAEEMDISKFILGKCIKSDCRSAVYLVENDRTLIAKVVHAGGKGDPVLECSLQRTAAALGVAPAVHCSGISEGGSFMMIMDRLQQPDGSNALTVADFYGESIPENGWRAIRGVLDALYDAGIFYEDRSAYNFMVDGMTDDVKVIDFEHAIDWGRVVPSECRKYDWNPDFA